MGIPKGQSLCIETHNNCKIVSNHWKWMRANTEGIASWCVLLHPFVLSVVSGPEWTTIWETAVTKRQKDVIKFFYILKMKQIIIKTWFAVIWSVYTSFWDTLYIHQPHHTIRMQYNVIFKRSLTGLNSAFFFYIDCPTKAKEISLPYYLPIVGERKVGFILFLNIFGLCGMLTASFSIWIRVTVFNSYDDIHYTTLPLIRTL